jgi:hypothetical protein
MRHQSSKIVLFCFYPVNTSYDRSSQKGILGASPPLKSIGLLASPETTPGSGPLSPCTSWADPLDECSLPDLAVSVDAVCSRLYDPPDSRFWHVGERASELVHPSFPLKPYFEEPVEYDYRVGTYLPPQVRERYGLSNSRIRNTSHTLGSFAHTQQHTTFQIVQGYKFRFKFNTGVPTEIIKSAAGNTSEPPLVVDVLRSPNFAETLTKDEQFDSTSTTNSVQGTTLTYKPSFRSASSSHHPKNEGKSMERSKTIPTPATGQQQRRFRSGNKRF